MNDDITSAEGVQSQGRTFSVLTFGDDVAEIELAALDAARKFFGDSLRLEIIRDYGVLATPYGHVSGKAHMASIKVRVIEPGDER